MYVGKTGQTISYYTETWMSMCECCPIFKEVFNCRLWSILENTVRHKTGGV